MTNQINSYQWFNSVNSAQTSKTTSKSEGEAADQNSEMQQTGSKSDIVELHSTQEASVTYSNIYGKKKLDASDIQALQDQAAKATENLRKLVEELILKQNGNQKISEASSEDDSAGQNGLSITLDDIEQAKAAISEDGEYGVNAVSDRLVEFAKTISGGDKTKLNELVSAIDEGFTQAKKALGGELPDICQRTYDETMRKLNDWASSEE